MKVRRWAGALPLLASGAAAALLLTACSGGPAPSQTPGTTPTGGTQPSSPPAGQTLSGEVLITANGAGNLSWIDAAGKLFTAEHPDVNIKINAVDPVTIVQTATQLYASDSAPDIGFLQYTTAAYPTLVKAGALTDISDLWTSSGLTGATAPNVIEEWTSADGKQYGLAMDQVWTPAVYYNKSLFEAAGITAPDGRVASLDEWNKIVDALKAKDIQPFAVGAGEQAGLHMMGALLQTNATEAEYADFLTNSQPGATNPANYTDGAFLNALVQLENWTKAGVFANGVATMTGGQSQSLFVAGGVAMLSDGSWGATPIADQNPDFEWGWFLYPSVVSESKFTAFVGDGMVIPTKAKNPEAAKAFLEFLATVPAQALQASTQGTIPIRNDMPADSVTAFPAQVQEQIARTAELGATSIWSPSQPVVDDVIVGVSEIITGQKTAQEVAQRVQKTVDEARAS